MKDSYGMSIQSSIIDAFALKVEPSETLVARRKSFWIYLSYQV